MSTTKTENDRLESLIGLTYFLYGLMKELALGVWHGTVPPICFGIGAGLSLLLRLKTDIWILNHIRLSSLYPHRAALYHCYYFSVVTAGFWGWAIYRMIARRKLTERLTEVFTTAGLKTSRNRCPGFVSDRALDNYSRKLTLSAIGFPKSEFERAKEFLGAGLQIYIDEIHENRDKGTIEILYSHDKMPIHVEYDQNSNLEEGSFHLGNNRSERLIIRLQDVPHLLIAGLTNSGKSTFLRQFILSLWFSNKSMEFSLIDLKGGLEFQLFENLKRIKIYSNAQEAIHALKRVEALLQIRMKLLKLNEVQNIQGFLAIPVEKRKGLDGAPNPTLGRHIVVIDEATQLFLTHALISSKEVQLARRTASLIAAQGRAVGIHLVIGTQRPDRNAVDPLTKTNLQGRLCFQMADNASSMTILDSGRATHLPAEIKGRAIWRNGTDLMEVQTPDLPPENAKALLKEFRTEKEPAIELERIESEDQEIETESVDGILVDPITQRKANQ